MTLARSGAMWVAAALLLAGGAARATTYYVADCQSGAAPACVPGDDGNEGTNPAKPWRSTAKVAARFGSMSGGDRILFARGGVWVDASMTLQNFDSSAANPITFDSYAPAWAGSAAPILKEARPGEGLFQFTDGGVPEADGGYVVQNLDLRGEGKGDNAVFTSQQTRDITLQNLRIEGFAIGVYCGRAIERVKLLNSTLVNNRGQGVLWECADSVIEGNTFDNNGWEQAVFDHSIYVNSDGSGAKNLTIRGNVLTNNAGKNGRCAAVPLVVHGVVDGLLIENNLIMQGAGTSGLGCWGIAVDSGYEMGESFRRVVIRGNTVVNVGGVGIGCAGCVAPVIENNVIVQESTPEMYAIAVPDRQRGSGDAPDSGALIRNNSIYFGMPSGGSRGIVLATITGGNGSSSSAGSELQVVSNLIYFGAGHNDHQCFDATGLALSNFTAFANNLCFHAGGNGRYSADFATLADAKAAGFDVGGLAVNPQLAMLPTQQNNWLMMPGASSPAVDAGHATRSSGADRRLIKRGTVPDIGAYEAIADPVLPGVPANFRID